MTRIETVRAGSPARRAGLQVGETLLEINGHRIIDVLDYKFYSYDRALSLLLADECGNERLVPLKKGEGEDLGLDFADYLMDNPRPCANRCVFCFVDQLPRGMRETLYFKDDDARLSFLMGNYITLTNLSKREIARILELHISPINISVHATNPELRCLLLGNKRAGNVLETLRRFAAGGIVMNCQIVACPGLNDGAALQQSMEDLAALYPTMNSVSIVPVGLTKHRDGLYPLRPYFQEEALATVSQVEAFAAHCKETLGSSVFWCSDELYLKAGLPLPEDEYYEDYAQLENGVGMLRLLAAEFHAAADGAKISAPPPSFSIATGVSAAPFLREMIDTAAAKCHTELDYKLYAIENRFFGETIDVAGLITGQDLISQLRGKQLGGRLLIAKNMLRHGETVFLDDVTLAEAEDALGVSVLAVPQDGYDLYEAIFEAE